MAAEEARQFTPAHAAGLDLAITSYGTLLRMPVLAEITWRLAILDEAQAIKNPSAKQTRAAKALRAQARIALTGTPVENSLGDLWSIFDFINPGLLGAAKQFTAYAKRLAERTDNPYGPLRELVRPYILRRMKTDRSVIADLPDKTEIKAHCHLSRRQAALYAQAVEDLARSLEAGRGHPAQGPGAGDADAPQADLQSSLAVAERRRLGRGGQRQVGAACARSSRWWRRGRRRCWSSPSSARRRRRWPRSWEASSDVPGWCCTARPQVKQRSALVQRFQDDETVPFFVLSLKAGGTGLTLTAASHVVHFDRWWNPAVENQATDRAFRIGQKKNVLVHKFVCRGTVEERIDAMIESKQGLSDAVLAGGGEISLTEMTDEALLRMVSLDLNAAMKD